MSNAKPSRPFLQPLSKMEVNIPVQRGEQIVRKPDNSVVARLEYQTGTIRENQLFPEDHPKAKTLEQLESTPEQSAPVNDGKSATPKPTRAKRGVGTRKGKGE